jgi:hypothetical protein
MNGPHFFGVRRGKLTANEVALRERVAAKHGVDFVYATIPGTGPQSWFECTNRGEPFNRDTANAVLADLESEAE